EYVSEENCMRCHKEEAKDHIESFHYNSLETLIDIGEENNPKCLTCHTTGYKKPGGFVDSKTTPGLGRVGCQACHGPGSAHIKFNLSKEQRKQTINQVPNNYCIDCHKIHGHHDLGKKTIPHLKKKVEKLQNEIKKLSK
ncbi:MAG: multiheme c-type cytochrome, partial [bacterium]